MMSPEEKMKNIKINENLSSFDIYRNSAKYSSAAASRVVLPAPKSAAHVPLSSDVAVASSTAAATNNNVLNEYDEDDEEDFIKIYFASGTVLKPSDEPYNLRSKINQANRELANDNNESKVTNAPGKVKFDNTVVVLDSFEDIGTVSIGTERLQGTAVNLFSDRNGLKEEEIDGDEILAKVDLQRNNEEDDQNDVVVCPSAERAQRQQLDTAADADKVHSSSTASFSRSFSSESATDDPLFINVIESGDDEFKAIMDRNNKTRQGSSAIDEHVTYFPELFTHSQYKMYENSGDGKTSDWYDGADDAMSIYVPKKLDADELRNKLKAISKERKRVVVGTSDDARKAAQENGKMSSSSSAVRAIKSAGGGGGTAAAAVQNVQLRKKMKQTAAKTLDRKAPPAAQLPPPPKRFDKPPRVTYYFELDPKGKLKPLNKKNARGHPHPMLQRSDDDDDDDDDNKSTNACKFFHINLKATKNDGNARSKTRITKTPNADLFLEFQADRSGNKGAKLVIKKKPAAATAAEDLYARVTCGGAANKTSAGVERPKLPGYNGLRSEYGLSAEQLMERHKIKMERERRRKEFRQKKYEEERKKRMENEKNFYKWLQQKKQIKKQSKACSGSRHSYPINRLTVSSARNSINFAHIGNQRKGSFALEELLKIKDENNGWFKF